MIKSKLKFRNGTTALFLVAGLLILSSPVLTAQESRQITGTVLDENLEALFGAGVVVEGTANGVITDMDGNFTIKVGADAVNLEFSFIGYISQTVKIPASGSLIVNLVPDNEVLQGTVVIGYGVQRKGDLTGSISTVSSEDFNKGVINSAEQLINGKMSGVQIVNGGGSPSASSTIRIRGGASLNASNDPLIVLDGVPMEVGGSVSGSGNFLSLINPNDIESMTVLKDASSTAIYGSRASNGVIIITTKK